MPSSTSATCWPRLSGPTLVIHRTNEQWVDVGNSRYLAAHITGAQLIEASGVDHRPWLGDADEILDAIETFLTGTSARPRSRRYATGAEALTRRERKIVALTVAGETAPAIATALFLSERTVESHLAGLTSSSACIPGPKWPGGQLSLVWLPACRDRPARIRYKYGCWRTPASVAL